MAKEKDMKSVLEKAYQKTNTEHDKEVQKVSGDGSREKRISISFSLSKNERDRYAELAKQNGLSMSSFLRLAAEEYVKNHNWE